MVARLLDRFFLFIISREMGIVLGVGICIAMVPMLLEQLYSLRTAWATHPTHELVLNQIAHHNGMGMLLVGLSMEIGTALIGLPKRVFDISGLERMIFGVCFALSLGAFIIMVDFVKDFAPTYWGLAHHHEGES
jgi:hypothetical protein